jgi:hypothetical protein
MTITASRERSWLAFCLAYIEPARRGSTRPRSGRRCVTSRSRPPRGKLDRPPATGHRPPAIAAALRWLEKASLPVSMISKPRHARAALDAISVQQSGEAAAATTIARKRSVFANVIRYAVELDEMPSSPLDRLSWTPPKVSEVVDRRVVVNPRQARELLTAVTYVGQQRRGPYARASGSWPSKPASTPSASPRTAGSSAATVATLSPPPPSATSGLRRGLWP